MSFVAPVASHIKGEPTEWQLATIFEKRIGKRFQLEFLGPVSSVTLNGERQTGYSDTELGLKTVLNPNAKNHLATFGFDFVLPTGNSDRGLSEGAGFEPYLATASAWARRICRRSSSSSCRRRTPGTTKLRVYRVYVGHDLNVAPTGWTVGLELVGENDEVALAPQIRKGLSEDRRHRRRDWCESAAQQTRRTTRAGAGLLAMGIPRATVLLPGIALAAAIAAPPAWLQARAGGTIVGTLSTKEAARPALRVTIDPSVCGTSVPDDSVAVDAAGHLANGVVTVTGVKVPAPPRPSSTTRSAGSCRASRSSSRPAT